MIYILLGAGAIIASSFIIFILFKIGVKSLEIPIFKIECDNLKEIEFEGNSLIIIIIIVMILISIIGFIISCIIYNEYSNIKSILYFKGSVEYIYELLKNLMAPYSKNKSLCLAIIILFCISFVLFIFTMCSACCEN